MSALFLALFVTACGGGGSGGDVSSPPVIADTTPPTITLSGDAEMRVEQGTEFTDPGASANDDTDGDVPVTVSGTVDAATAGSYTLTYTATDAAGNSASAERVVTVSDTTPPTVTLNGSGSITLEADATYTEEGATAVDSVDGTLDVEITGSVGSAPGRYTLTYTATDTAGNSAQVQRMVTVLEPEPPPTGGGADDQLVMTQGIVDSVWDRGINAFDQAIDWGDCSNDGGEACPSIAWEFVADTDRGDVLQVTHANNQNLAGLFFASSVAVDLNGYSNGHIEFDIKVVSGDPEITMKLDCFYPCTSGDQPLGERGASGWETVAVPISQLTAAGLNLSEVNTGLVIWASKFEDTVFQLDNVRFTGFDETAGRPSPEVTVPFNLTRMGLGSYSDTVNPASYRCVYDYGHWIYNAGVVEPGIPFCDTATGTPEGDPTPRYPQLGGAAANKPTMTHRWWGSVSFLGEMRVGDPNGAGYITPDPIMARLTERGARFMGIPPGIGANAGGFGYTVPDPFAEVFDGVAIANNAHSNMDVKLLDYSEGAITAGWFEDDVLIMEATFVYGSPFVFFEVYSGTPLLKTLRANGGERGVWHEGGDSLGIWSDVAGQRNDFLVVGDAGTTFDGVNTDTVTVAAPDNSFTLVWAPERTASVRQTLERYARNKVKHVSIDYRVDRSSNIITVSHRYLDDDNAPVETMAGLMPLQWKRAPAMDYTTSVRSARGLIKFAPMTGFDYALPSIGVLPALPVIEDSLNEAELRGLVEDFVAGGTGYWNTANDTYW
ncbi:MAG: immunoglobulin-like domain-containing protein, partial [Luminiphilus sp.]